jgi:TPR repeat protein
VHYFGADCTDPKARLGLLHREGKGVERDFAEGARLIWQTLGASNYFGSFVLGMAYERGYGVERDNRLARRCYEDAIEAHGWTIAALAEFFLKRLPSSAQEE